MKKILIAAVAFLSFSIAGFSQATPAKTVPVKKETTKVAAAPGATTKTGVAASNPAPATKAAATSKKEAAGDVVTKKDGTPDMRYKQNKAAAAPPKHVKKDGTPDMRYKENKKP